MKLYLYLLFIVTACMILQTNLPCAEEGEWEIMLDEFRINDIAHEGDYVWCATLGDGVLRYNKTNRSYTQYTTENGLPGNNSDDNNIYDIAVDKKGLKWIGTDRSLIRYDDVEFTQIISLVEDTPYFDVYDIEIDHDGSVWFVSRGGSGGGILAKYTPEDSTTSVKKEPLPDEITLLEARPNPFNPTTTISYSLHDASFVSLEIYSITGQKVATLANGFSPAGNHNVIFDGSYFGSGIYLYKFQAEGFRKTGKMLIVK